MADRKKGKGKEEEMKGWPVSAIPCKGKSGSY